MSRAVIGAAWTILTGIGSRGLGLVGTLWLTYYLVPDIQGAVSNASILANTAHQMSSFGVEHYLVANPKEGREVTWQVTVFHVTMAAIVFGVLLLFRNSFGSLLNAPTMAEYIPGCVGAVFLERIGMTPERLLARQLKFRTLSMGRFAGEISYTIVSVALATMGVGGMSIIYGNLVRSGLRTAIFIGAVERGDWLTPSRFSKATFKKVLGYGVPISIGAIATFASRRWDNLVFSRYFGEGVVGEYTLAYNLADIPATQVGEQIGDVLFPSFSQMEPEQRKRALVRSTALLSLIVFPLAVGLGAVAPTAIAALLRKEWAGVAPMLAILSALSVGRPVGWTVQSYLQASNQPRATMILSLCKIVFLIGLLIVISKVTGNPLWACGAVGIAFGLHSLASIFTVSRLDGLSMGKLLWGCVLPLVATAPMAAAILGIRHVTGAHVHARIELVIELVVGGLAYVVSALVIARSTSKDFIDLVRGAIARRRNKKKSDDD